MKIERTRLLTRRGGSRDARLFIIATEGSVTEKRYFEGLQQQGILDRRRVIVEVVAAGDDNRSAPAYVLERLEAFRARHRLMQEYDQLWLVMDLDRWSQPSHIKNLDMVIQAARNSSYQVAISNPCFELWLLLHFTDDLAGIDISGVGPSAICEACMERIRALAGSYDKSRMDIAHYTAERIAQAIDRAQALDTVPGDRWPQSIGTRVYLLARELLEHSRRNAL